MGYDLTNLDDIRAQATQLRAKERKTRAFSWLSMGQGVAYLLLLAAGGVWLRISWFQIAPVLAKYADGHWQTTAGLLLNGALDALMVVAGAVASAVIPPLLISALIP